MYQLGFPGQLWIHSITHIFREPSASKKRFGLGCTGLVLEKSGDKEFTFPLHPDPGSQPSQDSVG